MSFQQILSSLAALAFLASNASSATSFRDPCIIGKACTLVGTAVIYPPADGEQAWLEVDKKCAALALPDYVYAHLDRWNNHNVKVVGFAYSQPKGTLLYYTIRGRRISAGVCDDGPLIIVDAISLR